MANIINSDNTDRSGKDESDPADNVLSRSEEKSALTLLYSRSSVYSPYAYVITVFKNLSYLLGALVTAWSLKETKTSNDVILLVADDLADWLPIVSRVFDRIYLVPYLRVECISLRTEKQRKRYDSWMDVSCTKWNCIALTNYKKIVLLDADKLVLQNLDYLFDLETPAGTFSSPQAYGYCKQGGLYNPYFQLREGDKVKDWMVGQGLDGNRGSSFTVIGTSAVLTPNQKHYDELTNMLKSYTSKNPFGYPLCNNSIDEQVLAHFYSRHLPSQGIKSQWTYVSQRSGWIVWAKTWLRSFEYPPTVLHYFGQSKYWETDPDSWLDLQPVWEVIKTMIGQWPDKTEKETLIARYGADKINRKVAKRGCFYCKLFGTISWATHSFLDGTGLCPFYLSELNVRSKASYQPSN